MTATSKVTFRYAGGVGFLIIFLAGAMAQSQDSQTQESLGDTARKQQELHPKGKDATTDKVYTNDELAAEPSRTDSSDTNVRETDQTKAPSPVARNLKPRHRRPVFDRKDDSAADVIVVPAGTEIQVNVLDSQVAAPVRVGFSTPIPALSKVALHIEGSRHHLSNTNNFGLGDFASLISVTVRDVTYPVQTNTVPCGIGEGVFILSAPLRIRR